MDSLDTSLSFKTASTSNVDNIYTKTLLKVTFDRELTSNNVLFPDYDKNLSNKTSYQNFLLDHAARGGDDEVKIGFLTVASTPTLQKSASEYLATALEAYEVK